MEQNNELNQNQVPEQVEAAPSNNLDQNLEVFKQTFLADVEARIEQRLAQILPKPAAAVDVVAVSPDEVTLLKSRIEQMEKMQQSFAHHQLGNGQINSQQTLDKTKTLDQHIQDADMQDNLRRR